MTLDFNSKEIFFGQTMRDYMETLAGELPIDAVGLWQILPMGRDGFKLSDEDLVTFVRLCVLSLLERGAQPVIGTRSGGKFWILQSQYGEENEDIAEAVIAEWLVKGDPDPGGLWFALPKFFAP